MLEVEVGGDEIFEEFGAEGGEIREEGQEEGERSMGGHISGKEGQQRQGIAQEIGQYKQTAERREDRFVYEADQEMINLSPIP